MQDHYEEYWNRSGIYARADPLSAARSLAFFSVLQSESIESGRVLEVGCGQGDHCAATALRGLTPLGTDISASAVARAQKLHPSLEFSELDVEQRPWFGRNFEFDAVCSFEVIEHLLHPRQLIAGAAEVLKPGGVLAISTPYHGRIKNVAISLIDFERHFSPEGDHIRFLTDGSLREMFKQEGFEVLRVDHFGRAPYLWSDVFIAGRKK